MNVMTAVPSFLQAQEETSDTCPACHAGAVRKVCACSRSPARRLMARILAPASIASTSVAAARLTTSQTSSRRITALTTVCRRQGRSSRLVVRSGAAAYRSTSRGPSRPTRGNQPRLRKSRQVDDR